MLFDDDMEDDNNDLRTGSSAKIDQLVTLLRLTPETDKSLVFSQFTSFLDKVSAAIRTVSSNLVSHRLLSDRGDIGQGGVRYDIS